jgi:hypothetical protein
LSLDYGQKVNFGKRRVMHLVRGRAFTLVRGSAFTLARGEDFFAESGYDMAHLKIWHYLQKITSAFSMQYGENKFRA